MSEPISDATLVESIRNRFGIRGSTGLGLEQTIVPVLIAGSLDDQPFVVKGGGTGNYSAAAVAAQLGYVGLRAPETLPRNFRAVIRGFANMCAQTVLCGVFKNSVVDAVLGAPVLTPIDRGWDTNPIEEPNPRPALQSFGFTNAISLGGNTLLLQQTAVGQLYHQFPFVLAPGNMFVIQGGTANTIVSASFYWDEYFIG